MKPKPPDYKRLGISGAVSLLVLLAGLAFFTPIQVETLFSRLLFPLVRLMGFITLGLAAGQLIEGLGWTRQVAVVARPLFRFSHMGNHCSAAFTTAFISGAAANAMLLEFYEQEKITKLQLFLANYVNQFPAFFLHLPTTMFIVLPLTGVAGGLYFMITFLATLVRTACFLVFGHVVMRSAGSRPTGHMEEISADEPVDVPGKPTTKSFPELMRTIRKRLPARIINIFVWVLPIYTLVFLLNSNGVFEMMNQAMSRFVALNLMPVESLSVVILSFAAEFTSGFAAAGALLDAGVLTVKQTVIALLCGNILAFPIRALRHQLPRYMGIFSPKMGLQLLLSGQVFRVVSIILTGTLYYMVA